MTRWGGIVAVVLCVLCWGGTPARAEGPRVVFLNPGIEGRDEGWTTNTRFMKAAAEQFGIKLEVLYAERDRIRMVEQARQVAERVDPPDYVIVVNEKQQGVEILRVFQGKRPRLLLMHNDLTAEQRLAVGNERGALSNWIGTIVTDEHASARAVLAELTRRVDGPLRVIGITGDPATPVAHRREGGVRSFVVADDHGSLLQVVPGDWSRADGREKALGLLARYGDANVIWAANDLMALGALDAVYDSGRQGQVLVAGMGGFPTALASVGQGGMAATVGGHMMVGAWAMVLIHDYHSGHDFAEAGGTGLVSQTIIPVADAAAAAWFKTLTERPSRIDFHRLSRADNPGLGGYDFSYPALLRASR